MSAPDFAAIMADAVTDVPMADRYGSDELVGAALAAKVPELCRTCSGSQHPPQMEFESPKPCPDCPTIAKLLAIAAAVMSGRVELPAVTFGGTPNWQQQDRHDGAAWLLAELREVQP